MVGSIVGVLAVIGVCVLACVLLGRKRKDVESESVECDADPEVSELSYEARAEMDYLSGYGGTEDAVVDAFATHMDEGGHAF
jgi:hypothetical protein